jgi:hypothetical protein
MVTKKTKITLISSVVLISLFVIYKYYFASSDISNTSKDVVVSKVNTTNIKKRVNLVKTKFHANTDIKKLEKKLPKNSNYYFKTTEQ